MSFDFLMSPLISLAVRKAGDSLIQQFCRMHGMNRNCEKLHRQLIAIQAVMENAEHYRNEPHVHEWLKKLRAIAYRAVDVLDEFQYEALRWEAHNQNPCSSRIKKVMKCVTLHWNSTLFRHEMSKKLENVLEKVNEVITEMRNLSIVPIVNPQPAINKPPSYSWIIESDIIGRDGEKEIIINKLIDPIRDMENISVLPIIGMGGAGKTTLAQLVYNEEKVKEHFKLRMWIYVSTEFNIVNIMKSMIEVATNRECMPTSNLEVLQKCLHEILSVNKFLLVLDDVWNEEIEKWDSLKTLLFSVSYSGSVIIVTTRSKRVAFLMGTVPPHDLAMLSHENSWKLFRMRAFFDGEEPPQLLEIGRTIVEKCAGLPLALKVLGALMNTKREVHEWQAISENLIWDGEASAKEVLPALKLSYDHLPSYIKQCFTFCAMFPRDYEIQSEELIQLWMANDFIPDDGIMDLEEKGQSIFDELCLRCFFHDIRVREQHGAPWKKSTYYRRKRITYCKMHDLLHDLAKYIVEKQCATMLGGSHQVLHLLVSGNWSPIELKSILKELPSLRTCLIFKYVVRSENGKTLDSFNTTSLRALKMICKGELPMELGYMQHLRYLDLSCGKFDLLPETICRLYNLQMLDISYSEVRKLPEGMRYMIGLRHLIFEGCLNLKKLPVSLGQLKGLRTLTEYMVDRKPGLSISELKNLNDLHGHLILRGLENVKDRNEAEAANMFSKTKLRSLVLEWGSRNNEDTTINDQEVLEGLKPWELNFLAMQCYKGFDFPIWMKNVFLMRNLRTLILCGCINCTALPPLWRLPSLDNLQLISMVRLLYNCSTGITKAEENEYLSFPNLKKLDMWGLDKLEGWHEKDNKLVVFPKLVELKIEFCPKLTSLPYASSLRNFRTYHSEGIKIAPDLDYA